MSMVSLAKALKIKNRQVQKVNTLRRQIQNSNSFFEGSDPDFSVPELFAELQQELEKLWKMKATINAANVPIHALIYEMAELKGQILWLNSVSTTRGKSECGFGKLFTFEAQMDAQQVAAELQRLQDRLDEIQDQLDRHNVMTQVDL